MRGKVRRNGKLSQASKSRTWDTRDLPVFLEEVHLCRVLVLKTEYFTAKTDSGVYLGV